MEEPERIRFFKEELKYQSEIYQHEKERLKDLEDKIKVAQSNYYEYKKELDYKTKESKKALEYLTKTQTK